MSTPTYLSMPTPFSSSMGTNVTVNTTSERTVVTFDPPPAQGLVSYETRHIFQIINYVVLCGTISFFGIVSNVINIIVFVKQGFKDSINISLLGLATADLMSMITVFWSSICDNPLVANSGMPFVVLDLVYITGGYPHACFTRVSSFITAFITLERCLCILLPLKVKLIITPGRTKVINVVIFILMIAAFCPFYAVNSLEWKFHPSLNKTLLTLAARYNREDVESVTFFIHSVAFTAISLLSVIVCTFLLVIKLNQKTKWRQKTVAQTANKPEKDSTKEKKVVKMVTFLAGIFISCSVPPTIMFFVMAYVPVFSFSGRYAELYLVIWSIVFVLETINSIVNIFVYYNMSSKYKVSFLKLFNSNTKNKC